MAKNNTGMRPPLDAKWLTTQNIEDCINDVAGKVFLRPYPTPLDELARKLERQVSTENSPHIDEAVEELVNRYAEYRFTYTDERDVQLAEQRLRSLIGSEKTAIADEAVRTVYREVDAVIQEEYHPPQKRAQG